MSSFPRKTMRPRLPRRTSQRRSAASPPGLVLDSLLNHLTVGVTITRYPERIHEHINTPGLSLLGATQPDQVLNLPVRSWYWNEHDYQRIGSLAQHILKHGQGLARDVAILPLRHSKPIYLDISGRSLDLGDMRKRILWTHVDVTERRNNEALARQLNALYNNLLNNTVAAIDVVQYPERIFLETNQAFLNLMGYEHAQDIIGQPTAVVYPNSNENQRIARLAQHILSHGSGTLTDLEIKRRNGSLIYVDIYGRLIEPHDSEQEMLEPRNPERQLIVWTSVDVTQRHLLAKELERQALQDSLTGLPNRRALEQEIDKALARAQRNRSLLALVVVDLDEFKPINDNWGHAAGDRVLIAVGRRLQAGVRKTDFVARMGGDEFVLLLEDCKALSEVATILGKLERKLQIPVALESGKVLKIGASAGVCCYNGDNSEPKSNSDILFRRADQALYRSKANKRQRSRFWEILD